MSKVEVVGTRGMHGNEPGEDGERGGDAINRYSGSADLELVRAVGGRGGNGAIEGDGGAGGGAQVIARLTGNFSGAIATNYGVALGGDGGHGGEGGSGGDGGAVTRAVAQTTNTATVGLALAQVRAAGGDGGIGDGVGNKGGDGGVATGVSARAMVLTPFEVLAVAEQIGGNGGDGRNGADGGRGADSRLNNGVGGNAGGFGGVGTYEQFAIGGDGGDSAGGVAGLAGNAVIRLTLDNTRADVPGELVQTASEAQGGTGGSALTSGIGAAGGSAQANVAVIADSAVAFSVALGGRGGDGADGGGRGGNASAVISGSGSDTRIGVTAGVEAGRGGDALEAGHGGQGGRVLRVQAEASGTGNNVSATVDARGGDGGNGRGEGFKGGDGGDANQAVARATHLAGGSAFASIDLRGGDGGNGLNGADGGRGGDTTLVDLPVVEAPGYASMDQFGDAGNGGDAIDGGNGGRGGMMWSSLQVDALDGSSNADFLGLRVGGFGGDGGAGRGSGHSAGAAGNAIANGVGRARGGVDVLANTFAGNGGQASDGAATAAGGTASSTGSAYSEEGNGGVDAAAYGGIGGALIGVGTAGRGGNASVSAMAEGLRAFTNAQAYAGRGGDAYGEGAIGGAGGQVLTLAAVAAGSEYAASRIAAQGGDGGDGFQGADGGVAAGVSLRNVGKVVAGGELEIAQQAIGGAGGSSDGGRAAAGAIGTSQLVYDDTQADTTSSLLTLISNGVGGDGGSQTGDDGRGGDGGRGSGLGVFTAGEGSTLNGLVFAYGGDGGAGPIAGRGGNALATGRAEGDTVFLESVASAGSGRISGVALAVAEATGSSGEVTARALARGNGALAEVSGEVTTGLSGHAIIAAAARIGGPAPIPNTSADATIAVQGDPAQARLDALYAGNDAIEAAFGDDAEAVAISVIESRQSAPSADGTITSTFRILVDVAALEAAGEMGETRLGLFDGHVLGAGFDTLSFTVVAGNEDDFLNPVEEVTLVDEAFGSEAAADAYFDDRAIDLGNLLAQTSRTGELVVTVTLTTTGGQAGDGYGASILIGDVGDADVDPVFGDGGGIGPVSTPYDDALAAMLADRAIDLPSYLAPHTVL